jgi:outer membrane protein TolC
MSKFKHTIICILLAASTAAGQELTLEQCRKMALERNRKISVAEHNVSRAGLTAKATATNFLPKLSARGAGYYGSMENNLKVKIGEIQLFDPADLAGKVPPDLLPVFGSMATVNVPDININIKTSNTYIAGLQLEQPVYTGGKITSAYRMSKIGRDIAEISRELTGDEVILETDRAYWACVQTRELHKTAVKFRELVEESYRIVENACKAGMKPQNDLMKVQVQLNRAELELLRAENAIRLSSMNLCFIVGLPADSKIEPSTEETESKPVAVDPDANIFTRPEYAILNKQIELKKQEKLFVRSDFLPQIGIMGSYNYMYGVKMNKELLFDNTSFSALLSVRIPLFHWGEGVKKIRAADHEIKIMQLQSDDMQEKMQLELEQKRNALNEAALELRLTKQSVTQSLENLRMSRDHYQAGMETVSDYLEAQTIWQKAQSDHIISRTKLEISRTEYLKASGQLGVGD